MSNYTKTTNFTAKDSLISGNPSKIVKGSEIDAEFTAIETAVNSKSNTASPTFTGTATIPTAAITNITFGGTPITSTAAELNVLDGITSTVTELNYTDGVTSAIQAQIDAKAPLNSPVLVTPNLGTPSAGVLTNATGLPIVAGTTGTLSTARGGTGVTTASNGQLLIGNGSGFTAAALTAGSGVTLTNGAGSIAIAFTGPGTGDVTLTGVETLTNKTLTAPILSAPVLGTPASGLATNLTGLPLTTGVTGTLPVANGGTGITSLGTGVATALGGNINTSGGYVTQSGTLASNNVLLGGGSAAAVTSSNLLATSAGVTSGTYIKAIGYADTVVALGNTGTAINLDVVSGGVFTATLNDNATITLRFPVSSGASSFTLILSNDATPSRTVAYAGGSFKFPGGAATLSRLN